MNGEKLGKVIRHLGDVIPTEGEMLDEALDRNDRLHAQLRAAQAEVERLKVLSANPPVCRGCGEELTPECAWVADGCVCNSPRGINHGLVPRRTCTCVACDPEQTGGTRTP